MLTELAKPTMSEVNPQIFNNYMYFGCRNGVMNGFVTSQCHLWCGDTPIIMTALCGNVQHSNANVQKIGLGSFLLHLIATSFPWTENINLLGFESSWISKLTKTRWQNQVALRGLLFSPPRSNWVPAAAGEVSSFLRWTSIPSRGVILLVP